MKGTSIIILAILSTQMLLCCQRAIAQADQNEIAPPYNNLDIHDVSVDGIWISYCISNSFRCDSLVVASSTKGKEYAFKNVSDGSFGASEWFACKDSTGVLLLTRLQDGKVSEIGRAASYFFTANAEYLVACLGQAGKSKLIAKSLKGTFDVSFENVTAVSYNKARNVIAFVTRSDGQDKVEVLQLERTPFIKTVQPLRPLKVRALAWNKSGSALAYIAKGEVMEGSYQSRAMFCDLNTLKVTEIDLMQDGYSIGNSADYMGNVQVSDDGKRVFFEVIPLDLKSSSSVTGAHQVWNTSDKLPYPSKALVAGYRYLAKLAVWWPESGRHLIVTNTEYFGKMLTADTEFAVVYNPLAHQPQFNREPLLDLYALNLNSGKKTLIVEYQESDASKIFMAPEKAYIVFFKDYHWWLYNFINNDKKCLTCTIPVNFFDPEDDTVGVVVPYGHPGWSDNGAAILLYSKFDIWKIPLRGKAKQLTDGEASGKIYRIVAVDKSQNIQSNFSGSTSGSFKHTLLIKATGKNEIAYYRLTGASLSKLMSSSKGVSRGVLRNNWLYYIEESFNTPPVLYRVSTNGLPNVMYRSNSQHKDSACGHAQKISYCDTTGKALSGMLYYPVSYDPSKRYPMIVHVYEQQSSIINKFVVPTEYNGTGFNVSNYSTKGYFVLYPDIHYKIGNPGQSAVDCVSAAVNEALRHGNIDASRLGLIGHSFGGYETAFIITQTGMFRAAVTGAAITDLRSSYLYFSEDFGAPNYFQYEFGQLRMGQSYFNDTQGYEDNSPITRAKDVKTPLLCWAGSADRTVHPFQTQTFYHALKRLGKEALMLLYPEEGHILSDPANQQHLTQSIEEWFNHYLKDVPKPKWMFPDFTR